MVFIVPRGEDRLLVGGIVEPGQWDTDLELGSYRPLQDMLARCADFMPALAGLRLDRADPLRVGLRPYRAGNVRLEAEPGTRIMHNYGHGGAGVTLSWGCADDAADLAERFLISHAA
jgi:D-amino-acid oxidase